MDTIALYMSADIPV